MSLGKYSGKSKFSTWLYRLTYNFCINHIQRNRKKTSSLNLDYEIADFPDDELLQLRVEKLQIALDMIHIEDKLILLMKFQDGFSIQDIMNTLDLGESAVKMRIKRAKDKVIKAYNTIKEPLKNEL